MTNAIWIVCIVGVVAVALHPLLTHEGTTYTRKSPCQNNLKELALAVQVYWNDYDSKLPSSALVSGSKEWNKRDFMVFGAGGGEVPPQPGTRRLTYTQVIYDYMKNKDIYLCAHDPMGRAQNPKSSYWWKTAMDKAWYGVGCKKKCQDEKDYPFNADQVLLYEHREYHGEGGALRNGAQINVVYIDSHVKNIVLKNATSGDPVNLLADDDGEPMYYNYNNMEASQSTTTGPGKYIDPNVYVDVF